MDILNPIKPFSKEENKPNILDQIQTVPTKQVEKAAEPKAKEGPIAPPLVVSF